MCCNEGIFQGHIPHIDVINTVGSGDALVGAFAVAIARNMPAAEQLAYALRCASASCLSANTGHFAIHQAKKLRADITIDKLAEATL